VVRNYKYASLSQHLFETDDVLLTREYYEDLIKDSMILNS
jgi:hypothetical protein